MTSKNPNAASSKNHLSKLDDSVAYEDIDMEEIEDMLDLLKESLSELEQSRDFSL